MIQSDPVIIKNFIRKLLNFGLITLSTTDDIHVNMENKWIASSLIQISGFKGRSRVSELLASLCEAFLIEDHKNFFT